MNTGGRIPTVNDLRVRFHIYFFFPVLLAKGVIQVKLCYICREEERYDSR